MEKVIKTKKGLFLRHHPGFGIVVFSPFSGLFFAIKEKYVTNVMSFCNGGEVDLPDQIKDNLNIGISDLVNGNFEIQHYLPGNEIFSESNELPEFPIVINWLLSNKCNCKCSYCYAGDVIDKYFNSSDVSDTVSKILMQKPLAVVLSGGEPLLEKDKMVEAIQKLGGKSGIIVDTNGLIWDEKLVKLFKKYRVVVRISLDSLNEEVNLRVRSHRIKSQNRETLKMIVQNIIAYRENDIPVLIHSVMTSYNKNSLDDLFIKLPLLGVNGWRIFSVIKPNEENLSSFMDVMSYRSKRTLEDQQIEIKKKVDHFMKSHISKSHFSIQVIPTGEHDKNSVILVLPDGRFATENKYSNRKIEININSIFKGVDLWGHYERYLGKIKNS